MSTTKSADDEQTDADLGLTQQGAMATIVRHCDVIKSEQETTKTRLSLRDMYHHLIRRGECTAEELQAFFRPVAHHPDADAGRYSELMDREWWEDIGRPNLRALPGVSVGEAQESTDPEVWQFAGLLEPPEDVDEDHVIQLDDLRDEPELEAAAVLDDLDVSIGDRRDLLLELFGILVEHGEAETADLVDEIPRDMDGVRRHRGDEREYFDGTLREPLSELPGVSVERWAPRDPAEIQIDTYADVLEAREELDSDPTETWRVDR